MLTFSDNAIVWLYKEKNTFEIWKITDSVRPDKDQFSFDCKWAVDDPSTYTIKGALHEDGTFTGKIAKDGSECGRANGQCYTYNASIALAGKWHEGADIHDFVARFTHR